MLPMLGPRRASLSATHPTPSSKVARLRAVLSEDQKFRLAHAVFSLAIKFEAKDKENDDEKNLLKLDRQLAKCHLYCILVTNDYNKH